MIRVALLCLVSVLLSACGGGGGGGDEGGNRSGGGGNNSPPAFALTEANAVQAAVYVLAPLELLLPAESVVMNAAAFMRAYGASQWTFSCSTTPPVSVTATYADRDASGTVSVGDVIEVPPVDCAGGRRKLTFTLTQITTTLDQVAGRLEVEIETDGMKLVGGVDASLSFVPATNTATWRMANAQLTLTTVGTAQTVRFTSAQFVFTPANYSFTLTGGSVESEHLGGNYTFATVTPLAGARQRLPSSGELLLSAAGGSRARIAPPTAPGTVEEAVEYAVAATSSASFASSQSTLWTAIVRGGLFGWRPNEAPTLTNLSIQPPNPTAGSSLWVSYFADDVNGDALETTIEWRRNDTVVGDNGQWLNVATVRNDRISVTVTVSDGRLTATATTSITIGNPPPVLLSLELTPAQPDSGVDLVAVPNVFEPDGDPVTLTYEWTRDGTVIANRTTSTLPASETARDQTISVRVTASDGTSTVEGTASTTILDSPPRLSVASPPTTVAYGAPVTFTATVTDPDGDPVDQFDFVLAYGPAGMTVDADTGVVSWTANPVMFDRTTTFGWGITVDGPMAQLATGTIDVTDATRDYPLLRLGTEAPTWPAGLSVADFDDDGDTEMLIMSRRWLFELESDGAGGYRQSWVYPYALNIDTQYSITSMRNSVVTGDADGDGKHEIFASVGATLTKLDGAERRVVAQRRVEYEVCADLHYADLENDGASDLVCLSTSDYWTDTARIIVLRPSDLSIRYEFPQANYGRSLALGNVDTDAALEIVTAAGYVFDGATFANQWLYSPGFGMDVDTGDLDGDGVEEIVAAQDWTIVTGFSATLKTPLWEVQGFDFDSLLVADVVGDSVPEIVVGDGQSAHLTIYRYNTATNGVDVVDEVLWQSSGVTSIGVGDVDSDGQRELIWGSGVSTSGPDVLLVAGLDPALEIEWQNDDPIQLDGPFKGGELAGSPVASPAPLFLSQQTDSGYAGARLVRMPADGGALEVSGMIDSNFTAAGGIDVVDYDNDLTDEAFLASNQFYDGLFRAYDFFGDTSEWSSPPLSTGAAAADVTHADLTGDGRADLIGITSTGVVYAHDVYQQTLIWQSTTLNGGRRVFVANLDGDANDEPEIVVLGYGYVYVYRRNPSPGVPYLQIANYQAERDIIDMDIGDTDGDGNLEVVLLAGYYYDLGNVIRLDANLQPIGSFTLPWPVQTLAIEPSPTPRKNLIVSRNVDQYYQSSAALVIVGARSGGVVFESPPLIGVVQPESVHYVTLPGETRPRISIGTTGGMYLTR